jgi:putative MATE family efflux protein
MIFGIIGIVAFNLTDTFFIGKLGAVELAAFSFTFPVVLVVISFSHGLGTGAAAVISRAIGRGDRGEVRRLTTDILVLSLLLVAAFVLIGLGTIDSVFGLLGASNEVLPLIKQYMRIWYLGMIFLVVPMVGNNAIRARGDTKTPAVIMLVAVFVNIVLDPLLIFGIGPFPRLGLAGAALATVIARATTMVVALYVLGIRDGMLTAAIPKLAAVLDSWRRVLYIGLPAAATRIIVPVAIGVITNILSSFGNEAVAAFGVSSRIQFFAVAVIMALSSVIGPFVGQNCGAGLKARVERGIKLSNRFSLVWGVVLLSALALPARHIAALFNDNPAIIGGIVTYLRIVPVGYGLYGVFVLCVATLNVLNKPFLAAGLTIVQMFAVYVPLAYLGASLFGVPGVFSALAASYCAAGVISFLVLRKVLERILPEPDCAAV